jgi:hypothetical protein
MKLWKLVALGVFAGAMVAVGLVGIVAVALRWALGWALG